MNKPVNRRPCCQCAAFAVGARNEIDGTCRRRAPTLDEGPHYFPPVHPNMWCLDFVDPKGGRA